MRSHNETASPGIHRRLYIITLHRGSFPTSQTPRLGLSDAATFGTASASSLITPPSLSRPPASPFDHRFGRQELLFALRRVPQAIGQLRPLPIAIACIGRFGF